MIESDLRWQLAALLVIVSFTVNDSDAHAQSLSSTHVQTQFPEQVRHSKTPYDIEQVLESTAGSMAILRSPRSATIEPGVTKTEPTALAPGIDRTADLGRRSDQSEPVVNENSLSRTGVGVPSNSMGDDHPTDHGLSRYSPIRVPVPIRHGPYANQLEPYRARAAGTADVTRQHNNTRGESRYGEAYFEMWWQDVLSTPLGFAPEAMPVSVAGLTEIALRSSPYVKSILTEPKIRRNDLVIADSEFDALAFAEAKFADTNVPVGNTLTTGDNSDRFRDETFSSSLGLRKRGRSGNSWEFVQRGGFQDNNSTFLSPNPQGTTRLEISFTQPLMKDHGRAVNNTRVLLAQIDVQLANSEVREDLQEHLTDVTRAYWDLFQSRAEWLQRNRLLDGATRLHEILKARANVDSHQRQVLRAQVAVASRRSDLIRAEARIRNAQARLRMLTGDTRFIQAAKWELTPMDRPLSYPVQISTRDATLTALDNRPEIAQSIRRIQAVSAKVGAAKNQVLPRLDLILSSYVAGLEDKSDTLGSFGNQFSDGRPSYTAGLLYEIPIGNRAGRARLARNKWELTRSMYDFQQATEVAFAEVEIAVRETQTTFDEMVTKKQSIDAANREVNYLQQRWELLPDPNESAILLIEDLLEAQERLADEERAFVRVQVAYAMSWVQLRKVMGVLLRFDTPHHSTTIAAKPNRARNGTLRERPQK